MITSFSLAILAKQRTFESTVIDLNKKSESAAPQAPTQPATESTPAPAGQ
jgi:preprotein translocase subunit SecG